MFFKSSTSFIVPQRRVFGTTLSLIPLRDVFFAHCTSSCLLSNRSPNIFEDSRARGGQLCPRPRLHPLDYARLQLYPLDCIMWPPGGADPPNVVSQQMSHTHTLLRSNAWIPSTNSNLGARRCSMDINCSEPLSELKQSNLGVLKTLTSYLSV